ncbi:hypothetical protein ADIAL_1465 [Alkalibacterium sp. AK22]|uniref:hypothetical protein n=1 Tax=Alkalibacterium sp. AK22 TaxID=1229520 RepID=UPI00044AF4B4|nr:hypothetical protein [Alkalibacterium sp. AK22]EXJ23108.1 hypothetical protein ADIAL_1465 [Alkalibacterium sp. AK22]
MSKLKRRFVYVIDTPTESRELLIRDNELIENADGELDCPLDLILNRYHMQWDDLFQMNTASVSLVEEDPGERKMIRSISFEHLRYYKN